MDFIISFFRDTLVGPFYIVWVIVCIILIFACIGYLAEKGINNKKEKEKYATVDASDDNIGEAISDVVTSNVDSNVTDSDTGSNSVVSSVSNEVSEASVVAMPAISEVTTAPLDNNIDKTSVNQVNEVSVPVVNETINSGVDNVNVINTNSTPSQSVVEVVNDNNVNNNISQPVVEVVNDNNVN